MYKHIGGGKMDKFKIKCLLKTRASSDLEKQVEKELLADDANKELTIAEILNIGSGNENGKESGVD